MIKTILVATDGSAHAKKAVAMAIELANNCGARLVVLHTLLRDAHSDVLRKLVTRGALTKQQKNVLDTYEADAYAAMAGVDTPMMFIPAPTDLLQAVARQLLDHAVSTAKKAGVTRVSSLVVDGDAAQSIIDAAAKQKADLIVLGTRGLGELKGLFLGSVSHKVASRANRPCLTVK